MTHATVLLLAAGGSRRMGQPKQLLDFRGEPLVRSCTRTALGSGLPVRVVVGCARKAVVAAIEDLPVEIAVAADWRDGLSASIAAGVASLDSETPAALIALADQPLIDANHFRRLVDAWNGAPERIVATRYPDGSLGVPALFGRDHFDALRSLQGDRGASRLIEEARDVTGVDASAPLADIDTPEDYRRLVVNPPG